MSDTEKESLPQRSPEDLKRRAAFETAAPVAKYFLQCDKLAELLEERHRGSKIYPRFVWPPGRVDFVERHRPHPPKTIATLSVVTDHVHKVDQGMLWMPDCLPDDKALFKLVLGIEVEVEQTSPYTEAQ